MAKAATRQIERLDVGVDEAHRFFLRDVVIERFREGRELIATKPLNEVHENA